MENKATDMATPIFTLSPEMQATWDDIMGQMCAFVNDTNADVDMAYDWVCEMLDISSFVDNNVAWDSFYNTWESCENRNDLTTYVISWFFTLTHSPLTNNIMQESKFLVYGQHVRQHDGYKRNDCLSYMAETAADAVATCRKLYPDFVINYVSIDDTEVEVVKVQSLVWN